MVNNQMQSMLCAEERENDKMKKVLFCVLVLMLCLAIASCDLIGENPSVDNQGSSENQGSSDNQGNADNSENNDNEGNSDNGDEPEVRTTITLEEWLMAMDSVNFSAEIVQKEVTVEGAEQTLTEVVTMNTDTAVYLFEKGFTADSLYEYLYYEALIDGKVYLIHNRDGKYLANIDEKNTEVADKFGGVFGSDADFTDLFESLTYDEETKSYKGEYEIGTINHILDFAFEDGKVVSAKIIMERLSLDEQIIQRIICNCHDFGTTVVELPEFTIVEDENGEGDNGNENEGSDGTNEIREEITLDQWLEAMNCTNFSALEKGSIIIGASEVYYQFTETAAYYSYTKILDGNADVIDIYLVKIDGKTYCISNESGEFEVRQEEDAAYLIGQPFVNMLGANADPTEIYNNLSLEGGLYTGEFKASEFTTCKVKMYCVNGVIDFIKLIFESTDGSVVVYECDNFGETEIVLPDGVEIK